MHFLRQFWRKPHCDVHLTPEMSEGGVFKWLGTNGGDADTWLNPCAWRLAVASIFQPSRNSTSTEAAAKEVGEEAINKADVNILNGKVLGGRITFDTGLQVVPVAYRLTSFRNMESNFMIKNWCLQVGFLEVGKLDCRLGCRLQMMASFGRPFRYT